MSSPLAPYIPSPERPWNRRRAAHLLRRTGFGAPVAAIEDALAKGPAPTVDAIIDACVAQAPIPKPSWAEIGGPYSGWTAAQVSEYLAQRGVWATEFRTSLTQQLLTTGLHGRLTLFWHSHFTTEYSDYFLRPQFAYRYIDLIQRFAIGDVKKLTHDMGLNPAMLLYLNGSQNTRTAPNENYARELLELHTLGEGNGYTQKDIEELARAFTGYTVDIPNLKVVYVNSKFDNWYKTVFGLWENFNYSMAHDHVFTARRDLVARHISGRLYSHFVHAVPDPEVVDAMAVRLIEARWNVEPVLRDLFKSEHFFEDPRIGAMIQSPFVLLGSFANNLGIPVTPSVAAQVVTHAKTLGQDLLQPPNVAGWPGHRAWLDTSLLPSRWNSLQTLFTTFAKPLYDAVIAMPEHRDPYALAAALAERVLPVPLDTQHTIGLGDILLSGMPAYEWDLGAFGGFARLTGLLAHLYTLPESQLH